MASVPAAVSESRWVVVDDTDPGIVYDGPWFADKGAILDNVGNFGAPYLSTSHGTNSTASFAYTFRGSKVLITGSNQFFNPTGVVWQCIVDGEAVPSVAYSVPVNNLLLCEQDGLDDSIQHVITVNTTITQQQTFWFDYVKYLPAANLPLTNAAVSVDSTDPGLQFDAAWKSFSPGFETSQTSSTLKFNFSGVSLLYYGFYDPSLPFDESAKTASYAIDGQAPISFDTVVGLSALTTKPTGVRYNQLLFSTGNFSAGQHTLEVAYNGTSQSTPLTFEFLVVQNGTSAVLSPPSGSSSAILSLSSTVFPSTTVDTLPSTITSTATVPPATSLTISTSSAPTTTQSSSDFASYNTNSNSMLGLVTLAVTLLCRRNTRSSRYY